jgi:hypothetical protein
MSEEKDSNVKSTIEAVTGLVNAVPIYQDAVQPAAKQVGKALETVAKVVNIALVPLRGLVWGYDKIEVWLTDKLSRELENIPQENIITPPVEIAGPTIEALRYTSDGSPMRDLYASLLATSMNKETVNKAHPGYVEILKNLSKDEAILLKSFTTKVSYPIIEIQALNTDGSYAVVNPSFSAFYHNEEIIKELIPSYIDNLCRLGLLQRVRDATLLATLYEPLESDPLLNATKQAIIEASKTINYARGVIRTTEYGTQFINNVVRD